MSTPVLKNEKFTIRAFTREDLEPFSQYRAQKIVAKYQSWTRFTYEDAVVLFEGMNYQTFGTEGAWYQLAIVARESDQLVGDLAVHFLDQAQMEIGFTVSSEHQGKYVATEAVSLLLEYVFVELNKHRVVAITDSENTAAYTLLAKLGFRREAHFVQGRFFKGVWCDEYLYALLQSEWKSCRKSST